MIMRKFLLKLQTMSVHDRKYFDHQGKDNANNETTAMTPA